MHLARKAISTRRPRVTNRAVAAGSRQRRFRELLIFLHLIQNETFFATSLVICFWAIRSQYHHFSIYLWLSIYINKREIVIFFLKIFIGFVAFLVMACTSGSNGGSGDGESTEETSPAFDNSNSGPGGSLMDLQGKWQSECAIKMVDADSERAFIEIKGHDIVFRVYDYNKADCNGGPAYEEYYEGTIITDGPSKDTSGGTRIKVSFKSVTFVPLEQSYIDGRKEVFPEEHLELNVGRTTELSSGGIQAFNITKGVLNTSSLRYNYMAPDFEGEPPYDDWYQNYEKMK